MRSSARKKKTLYKPFVSTAKNKKYSVYIRGPSGRPRLIHFGDKRYGQFRDKLGHYKHLDHDNKKRRANYHARHGSDGGKKDSAKYWAHRMLW